MLLINKLPVLCLLKIFDFLSIKDLLQINTVCRHWNELYRSACIRRKCIQLEKAPAECTLKHVLPISVLSKNITKKIITLFPNLTTLNFKLEFDSAQEITNVYNFYSAILISTFLNLKPINKNSSANHCDQRQGLTDVLGAINSCANLKSLTLFVTAPKFINIKQKFTFNLPILAQLTHFRFLSSAFESVSRGDVNVPLDILEQFALGNEHLHIYLENAVTMQRAMRLDKKIAKSIKKTQLADTITEENLSTLVHFAAHFRSVEELILTVDGSVNGEQLGKSLKSLNRLLQLNLFSPAPLDINLYAHLPKNVIIKSNVYF